jgi:hypothetical protein
MAHQILHDEVPLAVLAVGRRLNHMGILRACPLELSADVLHPDSGEMRLRTLVRLPITTELGDDHGSVAAAPI